MNKLIILLPFILASCYTSTKAKKQISKAHVLKPEVTAEFCNNFYPVKDSVVKETVLIKGKNDTILSHIKDTLIDTLNNIQVITETRFKTIYRVDTVYKTIKEFKESTSKTKDLNNKLNQSLINEAKLLERSSNDRKSKVFWMWLFFIFTGVYVTKVILLKKI